MQNLPFFVAYSGNHIQCICPHGMRYPQNLYAQTPAVVALLLGRWRHKTLFKVFWTGSQVCKKTEEQKKSCMTNDSASPFKVSSKLAPSSFQAQRLAPWTRQNQLTIFSLRGAQGQSPWVQYVGTSNCRGNTASELGFESHGLRSNILPWKIPCQNVVNKTTCQQYSKKNAKQQIAITDSELQLLPHEDFSMKTHHKADTKDPALTNHNQPTLIPTSMFQVHLCRYP